MKLFRIIIIIAIVFFALVWALSTYLGVDDMRSCGARPSSQAQCGPADAVVALSGGDTKARAAEAITLFQHGWAKKLVFSGAAADKSGPSNAAVMQRQAIAAGVDPDSIILDEYSETTAENAKKTSTIFQEFGITSAIIVTSGYHERRAMLEFGAHAHGVTLRAHPAPHDKQWGPYWWLTTTGWTLALSETVHSLILSTGGVDRT